MKNGAFMRLHPLPAALWIALTAMITMFITDPVLLFLSLLGAVSFSAAVQDRKRFWGGLLFLLLLFFLLALTNPLFSHSGNTTLFRLFGDPVTLEALLCGVDLAAMALASLLWWQCFSAVMTTDKLLCLFGRVIPRLSLTLSLSLRFLPLFRRQWEEIRQTQIGIGYGAGRSLFSRIKGAARIFSALVTWALENAVDTASSMRARGHGLPGRSRFFLFRMTVRDRILTGSAVLLGALTLFAMGRGRFRFSFYPQLSSLTFDAETLAGYAAFALLSFLPLILECTEALTWKFLRSKI